jgi:hypothetical protein
MLMGHGIKIIVVGKVAEKSVEYRYQEYGYHNHT